MRRRLVLIWQNSSLLEHLPSDLLHGDKQVANKELVVMENQGMHSAHPVLFSKGSKCKYKYANKYNTKSWL